MAILLKNVSKDTELDFDRYAAEQKSANTKIASYGAVGSIAGVFLGNLFSVNIIYAGVAGFLAGAALGKYTHNMEIKEKSKKASGNG